ncbi:MAG: recombinase family protein [Dehalococcoidia bacterium]
MEVLYSEMNEDKWKEMESIAARNTCAVCGGVLTVHTVPARNSIEVACGQDHTHVGYVEKTTDTQLMRRGGAVFPDAADAIGRRMMLPGGYNTEVALNLLKARYPRAELDDPSAALFIMDCYRLQLDPLLGEIIPLTFGDSRTGRKVVQPIITEDGYLSLAARACPDRWISAPAAARLEEWMRRGNPAYFTMAPADFAAGISALKLDICGDATAYVWAAWGKVMVAGQIVETEATYGWYKTSESEAIGRNGTPYQKDTPASKLPGNQARVRAIKRWVRENFPEARSKMVQIAGDWKQRAAGMGNVEKIIEAEYTVVVEPGGEPKGEDTSKPEASQTAGPSGSEGAASNFGSPKGGKAKESKAANTKSAATAAPAKTGLPPVRRSPAEIVAADVKHPGDLLTWATKFYNIKPEEVWPMLRYKDLDNFRTAQVQTPWEAWQDFVVAADTKQLRKQEA